MPVQTLYRKWRPQLWDEVVGQEPVIQTLRNALRAGRLTHAYLFAGPRGCGKTTTARLVAKALNCLHADPAQRPDNTCDHCTAVNEGRFRPDLQARLEGMRLTMPPLRERRGDIPFLFLHLLRRGRPQAPMPEARILEQLCLYDWPLNVREMVSLVQRLLASHGNASTLSLGQVVSAFPELKEAEQASASKGAPSSRKRVDPRAFSPAELAELEDALERHAGNVANAAAELGISRQRVYRMVKSLGAK